MTIIDIPTDFHDPESWLTEYRTVQANEASAEELAVYAGPTVSVDRQRRYQVFGGAVRNRTQRGAW